MDRWRPRAVVGIAVMLLDVWLFVGKGGAFTVKTQEKKRNKKERKTAQEIRKPAESGITNSS